MTSLKLVSSLAILLLFACNKKGDIPESATSGSVRIAYDESFASIANQEKDVFEFLYKNARVFGSKIPQQTALKLFLRDSVKLIFSSRTLSKNEVAYLNSRKVYPKIYEFAQYGVVVIFNRNNPDSLVDIQMLKEKIQSNTKTSSILVVDNERGETISSLEQLLGLNNDTGLNLFSAGSVAGVIDYVEQNEKALGIISGTFISDGESSEVLKLRNRVRIAKVAFAKGQPYYYPYQSEIADSVYPLIRKIYIISRESKMGTANGFASFILGEKGQRIVLKAGLVPSKIPKREVVLSKKDIR